MLAESDIIHWSYCPSKWAQLVPEPKKMYLFLLGKADSHKYPEHERMHPKSIDLWSYFRICVNFWWTFGVAIWGFRPNLNSKNVFFLLNFTRILWFSGSWDLSYLILLRIQFLEKFWFPRGKWYPKMDQTCKLWVRSIWAKTQSVEEYFKHCICLIGDYLSLKFNKMKQYMGVWGPKKLTSRGRGCWIDTNNFEDF